MDGARLASASAKREGVRSGKALTLLAVLASVSLGCSKPSSGASENEEASDARLDNAVPPTADVADLDRRAGALFEAVMKDDPSLGEPFWFPKDPFVILKDPPDPAGYWEKLHRAYADDIHALHASRPSWDNAAYDHFELGSPARWMNPGDEHNRIGYYRSLGGSLHFREGDKVDSFVVDVIITWQGKWYVTHFRRVRR
jgi:hypothetical protein